MDLESQVLEILQSFSSCNDQVRREREEFLFGTVKTLDQLQIFFHILNSAYINDTIDMYAISFVKKWVNLNWDSLSEEEHLEIVKYLNPIQYIGRMVINTIIPLFVDLPFRKYSLSKPQQLAGLCASYVSSALLDVCSALSGSQSCDSTLILVKIAFHLVKSLSSSTFQVEIVESVLTTFSPILTLESFVDPSICQILLFSFKSLSTLIYYSLVMKKCPNDPQLTEQLKTSLISLYSYISKLLSFYIESQVYRSERSQVLQECAKFIYKDLSSIALETEEAFFSTESYSELVDLCFQAAILTATTFPDDRELIKYFLKVLTIEDIQTPLNPQQFSFIASLAKLKQIDLEDFSTNPSLFYSTAYSASSVSPSYLRNVVLCLLKKVAKSSSEDEFIAFVEALEPCESSAAVLGVICKNFVPPSEKASDATKKVLKSWIENLFRGEASEVTLSTIFILLSNIISILDEESLSILISKSISLLLSRCPVLNSAVCRFYRKLQDKGATLDPSVFSPILVSISDFCYATDLVKILMRFSEQNPELNFSYVSMIGKIITMVSSEMGESGGCDGNDVLIYWSNLCVQFLNRIISKASFGEEDENIYKFVTYYLGANDTEPITELLELAKTMIEKGSEYSINYLEYMFHLLQSRSMYRNFIVEIATVLIPGILRGYSNVCVRVFEVILPALIEKAIADPYDMFAAAELVCWALFFDESQSIEGCTNVIDVLLDGACGPKESKKNYICTCSAFNILASVIVSRSSKFGSQYYDRWASFLSERGVILESNCSIHLAAIDFLEQNFNECSATFSSVDGKSIEYNETDWKKTKLECLNVQIPQIGRFATRID